MGKNECGGLKPIRSCNRLRRAGARPTQSINHGELLLKKGLITLINRYSDGAIHWSIMMAHGLFTGDPHLAVVRAAQEGDVGALRCARACGVNFGAHENQALQWAAFNGRHHAVRYLVSVGNVIDLHAAEDSPLRFAARHGRLLTVRYLLAKGANVHAVNNHALRYASSNGHLEIVKLLVQHGADVGVDRGAPFRWAVASQHMHVAGYLKARMDEMERHGYCPVHSYG